MPISDAGAVRDVGVRLRADGVAEFTNGIKVSNAELDNLGKSADRAGARLEGLNAQQRLIMQSWREQAIGVRGNSEALGALDDELAQFMARLSPAYAAVKQLDTGHDLLTRSLQGGLITQKQYDAALATLQAKYGPAARGAKELGQAHDALGGHSHAATREVTKLFAALGTGDLDHAAMEAAMLGGHLSKIGVFAAIGIGAAVTSIGALTAAIVLGHREMERMNTALAATGGYAGMTRGQMEGLSDSVSRTGTLTIGTAKDIVTAIVASGRYASENVSGLARLVDNYAATTGQSADKAGAQLVKMFESPTKASEELARQYHHLSVAELDRIRTLEETGRTQEAVTLAIEKLNERLPQHAQNIGLLESAWIAVKKAASDAWDSAERNWGKELTPDEQIKAVDKRMAQIVHDIGARAPANKAYQALEAERAQLVANKAELADYARQSAVIAANKERELLAHKEIEKSLLGQLKTLAHQRELIQGQPGAGQRLAEIREQELGIRKKLDEQRMARLYPGFAGALAANEASYNAVQEREYQAGRMRLAELEKGKKLEAKGFDAAQAQRGQEKTDWSAEGKRQSEAYAAIEQRLRRSSEDTNAALIADTQKRARVQLDIEKRRLDEEINALGLTRDQKKQLLDQADVWYVDRQRKLTEDLKPEWQKMLDAWNDTNRLMRESFDNFVVAGLRTGESMFIQFARTGKLSIKQVANFVAEETARLYYRKNLAEPIASGLGGLGGLIGGLFGGGQSASAVNSFDSGVMMPYVGVPTGHAGMLAGEWATGMKTVAASVFSGARRMHNGGLAGDEVPAILRRREEVLTEDDPRHRFNFGGGGSTINAPLNVTIDARNAAPGMENNLRAMIRQEFPNLLYQHRTNIEGLMRSQAREKGRRA